MSIRSLMKKNKIDKQVIVTGFMIIMLCVSFYFIGYGNAYKKAVVFANNYIRETLREDMEERGINSTFVYDFLLNQTKTNGDLYG